MTYQQSVRTVFSKLLVFKGRASRSEYWWFVLFMFLLEMAISLFIGLFDVYNDNESGYQVIQILSIVALPIILFLASLSVGIRRLHDSGNGGGWIFIGLVPYIGWLVLIVFMALPSEPGDNRFGPNPTNPVPPIPNVKNEAYQN